MGYFDFMYGRIFFAENSFKILMSLKIKPFSYSKAMIFLRMLEQVNNLVYLYVRFFC